jgi:hypothetical protein
VREIHGCLLIPRQGPSPPQRAIDVGQRSIDVSHRRIKVSGCMDSPVVERLQVDLWLNAPQWHTGVGLVWVSLRRLITIVEKPPVKLSCPAQATSSR